MSIQLDYLIEIDGEYQRAQTLEAAKVIVNKAIDDGFQEKVEVTEEAYAQGDRFAYRVLYCLDAEDVEDRGFDFDEELPDTERWTNYDSFKAHLMCFLPLEVKHSGG